MNETARDRLMFQTGRAAEYLKAIKQRISPESRSQED